MFDWLNRKRPPAARTAVLGELPVPSGAVAVCDPTHPDPVRVDGLPPGGYRVSARFAGGCVAGVELLAAGSPRPDDRRRVDEVCVDSATVFVADAVAAEADWAEDGPSQVGFVPTPGGETVARQIGERFGLRWRRVGLQHWFIDPIPPDLEQEIEAFVRTLPKGEEYPFFLFQMATDGTGSHSRMSAAMGDGADWAEVTLRADRPTTAFVVSSGRSDGTYPVEVLLHAGRPVGVAVAFDVPAPEGL